MALPYVTGVNSHFDIFIPLWVQVGLDQFALELEGAWIGYPTRTGTPWRLLWTEPDLQVRVSQTIGIHRNQVQCLIHLKKKGIIEERRKVFV